MDGTKTQSETRWLRIAAIVPSVAMVFMDQTILPVALPVIQEEFGSTNTALQWSVNSYFLGLTVFVLLGGKLGDRIGHRKAFLLGMILFAGFSALCGVSPSIGFLIAARALQGLGAAIMFPSQTALIATSFPLETRGRATGIVISLGSIFLVLGPMIGGILTQMVSWRWIFWINLPISIVGIALILALLPKAPKQGGKVDLPGFAYFAVFTILATLFFMQGQDWGWTSKKILSSALLASISLYFLIRREKKAAHPYLEISLFKRPIFAAINMTIGMTQFILMITVLRTIYTEEILGYTPAQTGFITSLSSLPILFCSYFAGILADKVSPKLPISIGYVSVILSFFWLGFFPTPSLPSYFVALFLFGLGIPFLFTPSYTMAMSAIPKQKLGVAFGMVATLRNFAGTMGLSMIYLFVDVNEKHILPLVGARLAEIRSFSAVHFLLGVAMILTFSSAFYLYSRKSAHRNPDSPAEGWD